MRSLNICVKNFLFYFFYIDIYRSTTDVTKTGLSPVEQRTKILRHLIDRRLVDLPTDDQLTKLYHNYKHEYLTKEMFDEMSRDREIICTQVTSLESRDTQGRGGSCDVMSREEFDKLYREIEREWTYKWLEVRLGKSA